MTYIKPIESEISINGDTFTKDDEKGFLRVSFYRNQSKQMEVSVEWDGFRKLWQINFVGEKHLWVDNLKNKIRVNEKDIPIYFTPEQNERLDRVLDEVLLKNI